MTEQRPAPTSAVTWGCAGLAVAAVAVGLYATVDRACTPTRIVRYEDLQDAGAPPTSAADAEARDAVTALQTYWPIGQEVNAADWAWASCSDRKPGFAAMKTCFDKAKADIEAGAAKLPATTTAKGACGKEIAEAHRAYVSGVVAYMKDSTEWLAKHKPKIQATMGTSRTLGDYCNTAGCDDRPVSIDPKYSMGYSKYSAGYQIVMGIACTKTLFQCDQPDNVCWVNKVAARLGLGPDKPGGSLTVRSTGTTLR